MFRTSLTSDVSLLRYLSKPNFWYSFSFKLLKTNSSKFQSTYPRRVRQYPVQIISNSLIFQSTHPRRVRLHLGHELGEVINISIHAPAKGATAQFQLGYKGLIISIHAPAKGATWVIPNIQLFKFISIHAPAKGATVFHHCLRSVQWYFNPRTREGCDTSNANHSSSETISIHAPAKGATVILYSKLLKLIFQSTHPRRVRHL